MDCVATIQNEIKKRKPNLDKSQVCESTRLNSAHFLLIYIPGKMEMEEGAGPTLKGYFRLNHVFGLRQTSLETEEIIQHFGKLEKEIKEDGDWPDIVGEKDERMIIFECAPVLSDETAFEWKRTSTDHGLWTNSKKARYREGGKSHLNLLVYPIRIVSRDGEQMETLIQMTIAGDIFNDYSINRFGSGWLDIHGT